MTSITLNTPEKSYLQFQPNQPIPRIATATPPQRDLVDAAVKSVVWGGFGFLGSMFNQMFFITSKADLSLRMQEEIEICGNGTATQHNHPHSSHGLFLLIAPKRSKMR